MNLSAPATRHLPQIRTLTPIVLAFSVALSLTACKKDAPPAAPAFQAMPVMVKPVSLSPVPTGDTYVSTIKSRRSATIQPQVDFNLT